MRDIHSNSPAAREIPVHRNRNVISALAGIVGFFMVWGCALSAGGDYSAFVNPYGMLLVVIAPLAILTVIYGWSGIVDACVWVFRKPTPCKTAEDAVVFFQLAAAFAMASGLLGTLAGLIVMLTHMDSPQRLGPGMAVALLSQLYGVFLAVACIAVAAYTARRHGSATVAAPVARRAASMAGVTTIAGTLTTLIAFGILMLSLAPNL